jgi:type IV secretory pathway VirB2 component (pilin)
MTRFRIIIPASTIERTKLYLKRGAVPLLCLSIFPLAAYASPFDTGINSIQTLFTGTIAKAASLIAIVIGGYTFAHGEPGAGKTLAGVAAGTEIAIMASNVLAWLWGSSCSIRAYNGFPSCVSVEVLSARSMATGPSSCSPCMGKGACSCDNTISTAG